MIRKALIAVVAVLLWAPAMAAPFPSLSMDVGVCDPNAPQNCIKPDSSGNVPITGTISASLGGFTPSASGARGTPLSVTTSDSSGTLPTGNVVIVSNVGTTNPMYCNVNGVAATVSDQLIGANSWFAFTIPAAVTTLHCIATGGSTTANSLGGAGLATGAGGGSAGGGGGGGNVNLTQILGAAPSATNPLWMSPATGATFPVSIASPVAVTGTFWQATQPVSGTVTANVGTGTRPISAASGAYAAGALAAGAFATGAGVDGWDITQGAKADAVCGTATGSCSVIALLKFLNTAAGLPLPTQAITVQVGSVGIIDSNSKTALLDPCQYTALVRTPISIVTAANIKIVTGTASKKTYVCGMMLFAGGTANVAVVEGSGTNCGTSALGLIGGATAATGLIMTAQAGFNSPPAGYAIAATTVNANDICLINSAAVQVSGYIVTATP